MGLEGCGGEVVNLKHPLEQEAPQRFLGFPLETQCFLFTRGGVGNKDWVVARGRTRAPKVDPRLIWSRILFLRLRTVEKRCFS